MKLGSKFPHKKLFKLAKVLHLLDSMDLDYHNGIKNNGLDIVKINIILYF